LPYIDSVRLLIQANRDAELLRFRRGELHAIDKVEPAAFERLRKEMPPAALDVGPSLDSEVLWFNQALNAPLPAHKLRWFRSAAFRRAVSGAIQRDDIAKVVYRGYARPAAGHVSPSNRVWAHAGLQPHPFDPAESARLLQQDGFQMRDGILADRDGNRVELSVITNATSRPRTQMAAMLQQDLKKIGIQVNVVTLEFGSLIERITQTNNYEVCLLGFNNVELDPNSHANVFLSSGILHAWNPGQKAPATTWEAEIDRLMRQQSGARPADRKKAFDRVQEIIWREAPILYLVHPNILVAVSPRLRNVRPSPLPPHLYWNIEQTALQ
jgi:peptide/nickel transport system substrate-binding protein